MSEQIQATVYQVDNIKQSSPINLSFLTNTLKIREARIQGIDQVNSAIYYYDTPDATTQFKIFYVSESISTLLGESNIGSTTQILGTVLSIDGNVQIPNTGILHTFPVRDISIWPFTSVNSNINSYIEFKGAKYFCTETEQELSDAANAGGSGITAIWGTIGGTLSNQTDLQTALDNKIDKNSPISANTKTKITYDTEGLIISGADATTADISDSTNKRYVTDAQLIVINNTSGVNTGDQTITLTGDVTGSGTSSFVTTIGANKVLTANILNANVTYSKIQNVSANRLLGNPTGVSSAPSEIPLGTGLAFSGGALINTSPSSGGTVTTISVSTANGLAGSVSNPTTTPAITLSTTITGILKGNGTAISAATSGTDYSAGTSGLATGIIKSTTGTGNLSIAVAADFPTLNQNTTGSAGSVSGTNVITNANLRQGIARSVIGVTGNATANVADIQGSANQILRVNSAGTALAFGSIDISQSASITGTLPVGNGGTGTSTQFTPGSLIFAGASGVYTQDNSNLFFNDASNFLGIRVNASPTQALDVQGNIQNIYGSSSSFSIAGTANLTGNNGFAIFVQGKYAYVTDLSGSKLSVVDVSTPSTPAEVGSVTLTGQLRGIHVQGRYAYVAAASPGDLLYVVDISNPSSPTSVGSVSVSDARSVTVSGKYAFVFNNNGASSTIKVVDISVPTSPTIVGSAAMDNGVCGKMDVKGKYLFACASSSNTISIFDITDPTNPTLVSGRFNTGGTFALETSGRYLYTINTSGLLAIVDISNPASPVVVNTPATFTANGSMFLAGRYLYLVDSSNALLRIVDVSNPTTPSLAATTSTGASPSAVFVSGRYAYLTYSTNPDKISIIDIGGIESNTIRTSTAIFGKASITENLDIVGYTNIGTGLYVGNEGAMIQGSLSVVLNSIISGYTKLGDLSSTPSIKTATVTGTTASSQGNQVFVNHNIPTPTKIILMHTFVDLGSGTNIYITPGYRYSTGYEFSQRVNNTQIVISNVTGNSGNILSLAFKTFLIYQQ